MNRSSALHVLALALALSLFAGPIVAFPAEAPPDRIEYYVESADQGEQAWDDLEYANFSPAERDVFDAARSDPDGLYNATLEESPPRVTPGGGGISVYDVRVDDGYYLLQVKHFTYQVDLVSQLLPRLLSMALGIVLGVGAVYREFLS